MLWQSYENQRITLLDEPMAEQLSGYLENKESLLSWQLLKAMPPFFSESGELGPLAKMPLSTSVEEFGRQIKRSQQISPQQTENWRATADHINHALWNYIEILEGCALELFQQIDQIGFEHWNADLAHAVATIKNELIHRMDDLIWAIRRLEHQLKDYRWICEEKQGRWVAWRKIFSSGQSILDRSMKSTIKKCQKYLNFRHGRFVDGYTGYQQLHETAEQALKQLYNFRVLSSMDVDVQGRFKRFYFLLKIWDENLTARILPLSETIRALRLMISPEGAFALFREYISNIRQCLFDKSRMIKKEFRLVFADPHSKRPILDNVASYREELKTLKKSIASYEKFSQGIEKDFSQKVERFPSPFYKPKATLALRFEALSKDIDRIDDLCTSFNSSVEKETALDSKLTTNIENSIDMHLHEMGQPLASSKFMRHHAKALLTHLQELDELGSFHPEVVAYVGRVLCKAMGTDWKHQVLHSFQEFHHLYEIHHQLTIRMDDRQHLNRLHKFRRILEQIEQWALRDEALKHIHEIELDINDLKVYLQDFLAYIQRLKPQQILEKKEDESSEYFKANQALLEYLYLFGNFFHKLNLNEPSQLLIRKQLLFVNQYFETIERALTN